MASKHPTLAPPRGPRIPGPHDPEEMQRFLDSFMYGPEAFLVDAIHRLDAEHFEIEAEFDTERPLPFTAWQRNHPGHPAHVAAAEILQATGSLGCLHAGFFHGCRWDEDRVGFGNRIHRADFKTLARIGPPIRMNSTETRSRVGPRRVVLRYSFEFEQEGQRVYVGDQTAMFMRDLDLSTPAASPD